MPLLILILLFIGCSDGFIAPTKQTFPSGKIAHDLPDSLISDIAPEGSFNIRIRMSDTFDDRWPREKNVILGKALDKWESVIVHRPTNDYPVSGMPLSELGWDGFDGPDSLYFGEYELEISFHYSPLSPGFASATAINVPDYGSGGFLPISGMIVGRQFFELLEDDTLNDSILYLVLLHEIGHAIGFGNDQNVLAREIRGRFGHSCIWTGANALKAWSDLLNRNDHSFVPLEQDCGHWDYRDSGWKQINDVMFPSTNQYKPYISSVTVGYFDDLGFGVNYENAEDIMPSSWGVRPAGKTAISFEEIHKHSHFLDDFKIH